MLGCYFIHPKQKVTNFFHDIILDIFFIIINLNFQFVLYLVIAICYIMEQDKKENEDNTD